MKKLALAAAVAAVGLVGATGASAKKLDIALDGFCNTFTLHFDSVFIYGLRSGCGYTVVDGGTDATVGSEYYITNDQNDKHSVFTWYFTPPVNGAGSWFLYNETKKTVTESNSGTYTVTGPGAKPPRGGADVTASAGRAARSLPVR